MLTTSLIRQPVEEVKVDIPFGEYANPSFESQVETMAKARPGVALMSVEAQVEELYGDTRDETVETGGDRPTESGTGNCRGRRTGS
ncbi:MAG: hypothetical protein ACLT76_18370 [Clostridium fessum]